MAEYEAAGRTENAKIERLRSLRLAKEVAELAAEPQEEVPRFSKEVTIGLKMTAESLKWPPCTGSRGDRVEVERAAVPCFEIRLLSLPASVVAAVGM